MIVSIVQPLGLELQRVGGSVHGSADSSSP